MRLYVTFTVFIAPLLSNTVDSTEKPDKSNVQVQVSKSKLVVKRFNYDFARFWD